MNPKRKTTPLKGRFPNQSQSNHTPMKSRCKRTICLLSLWGLISPKAATAILRALGVTDA